MQGTISLSGVTFVKGEQVEIEQGKAFVLEFWATWCPPCRTSIPHLTELQHKYKDIIFVGLTSEQPQAVRKFVTNMGNQMDYRVGIEDGSLSTMFRVQGIPHAVVIDTSSKVKWSGHPMEPGFEAALRQCAKELEKGKEDTSRIDVKGKDREYISALSVKDLKQILTQHGLSYEGLPEKTDLIDKIMHSCV